MKQIRKRAAGRAKAVADSNEFAELYAFQNRIEELLMTCEGVAIGMSDHFVFEVWGKLRYVKGSEMVRLAVVPGDLREAILQAYLAAEALQRPHLIHVRTLEEAAALVEGERGMEDGNGSETGRL